MFEDLLNTQTTDSSFGRSRRTEPMDKLPCPNTGPPANFGELVKPFSYLGSNNILTVQSMIGDELLKYQQVGY